MDDSLVSLAHLEGLIDRNHHYNVRCTCGTGEIRHNWVLNKGPEVKTSAH